MKPPKTTTEATAMTMDVMMPAVSVTADGDGGGEGAKTTILFPVAAAVANASALAPKKLVIIITPITSVVKAGVSGLAPLKNNIRLLDDILTMAKIVRELLNRASTFKQSMF